MIICLYETQRLLGYSLRGYVSGVFLSITEWSIRDNFSTDIDTNTDTDTNCYSRTGASISEYKCGRTAEPLG